MLGLDKQKKEFDIVISDLLRCHYDLTDFYNYLNKSGYTYYLCVHDKDVNDTGELKREHLHLVLDTHQRIRCKKIINDLADVLITNVENIQIMEVVNFVACVQYLIHKNNPEKYQYSVDDLITNDIDNMKNLMLEDVKTSNNLSSKTLMDLILVKGLNRSELMLAIGIGRYQHYRATINDLYQIASRHEPTQ